VNAEDPARGFLPTPGLVTAYREPAGPGVRVDSGVVAGTEISELYDPMIAKLVVWDRDRESARRRMLRALDEFVIEGPSTLLGFHKALLSHPCFVEGGTCHGLVESELLARRAAELAPHPARGARLPAGRARERVVLAEVDGRRYEVTLPSPEPPFAELARRRRERASDGGGLDAAGEAIVSPMQGTVLAVEVAEGDEVREGQVICIVEAMKMENEITAHRHGRVGKLSVRAGEPIGTGQVICLVGASGDGSRPDPAEDGS
jgi:acetyl-CoA/propionyl-CoA carboxylase biotin carboxyl carrier protein